MKIKNYILGAMAVVMATFTSCSDKGYWDEYVEEGVKYSFEQPTLNAETPYGPAEFTVNILRSTTVGSASVPVSFEGATDGMTATAQASFADGQNVAPVTISIANAIPGTEYSGTLSIPEESKSVSGSATCSVNISVLLTWTSLGTGLFIDGFICGNEHEVEILKADGVKRWRVMHPYDECMTLDDGDWEDWRTGEYPEYIEFWELDNGKLDFNPWNTGLVYQANPGDYIVAYPGRYFSSGSMDKNIWYAPGYACLSPFYYIDGIGGWNNTTSLGVVQIILPEFLNN